MKKRSILALLLAIAAAISLTGCGSTAATSPSAAAATTEAASTDAAAATEAVTSEAATKASTADAVELTVFAAASMTETLDQVIANYEAENPGVTITATYDSSGTLKTQIQEGAYCDVFISAAQKQMNQLDSSKSGDDNPDGLDFVLQGSRVNILENKVVLAVPNGNPANITSFQDLTSNKLTLLALGNSDVPVGSYSLDVLASLGLDADQMEADGKITYGSNVKEVTTAISEGTVDAGIIYATDAYSAGLTVVDTATTDMCKQVIYPAAVLNISNNQKAAQAFVDYLTTTKAMDVFTSVGFTAVS